MSPVLKVWCRTVDILLRFLRGGCTLVKSKMYFKKNLIFSAGGGGGSDCLADHQKFNVT